MTRHQGDRLRQFIDGELDPSTRDRMLSHLAQCAECRTEADAERRMKARLFELVAPVVPAELMLGLLSLDSEKDGDADDARNAAAPGSLLREAVRLQELAKYVVEAAAVAERERGTSWEEIGGALGVGKSRAYERFAPAVAAHNEAARDANGDSATVVPPHEALEARWSDVGDLLKTRHVRMKLQTAASNYSFTTVPIRLPAAMTDAEADAEASRLAQLDDGTERQRTKVKASLLKAINAGNYEALGRAFDRGRANGSLNLSPWFTTAFEAIPELAAHTTGSLDGKVAGHEPARSSDERLAAIERRLTALETARAEARA